MRVREVGLRRRPDSEVLQYAADGGLIVVSHDVNTMIAAAYARLAEQRAMAGLLMAKQTAPVGPIIDSLLLIWASSEAEEWHGVVEFLPL